jgi:hypothetical protein
MIRIEEFSNYFAGNFENYTGVNYIFSVWCFSIFPWILFVEYRSQYYFTKNYAIFYFGIFRVEFFTDFYFEIISINFSIFFCFIFIFPLSQIFRYFKISIDFALFKFPKNFNIFNTLFFDFPLQFTRIFPQTQLKLDR